MVRRLLAAGIVIAGVFALFTIGFVRAYQPVGSFHGLVAGLVSATFWALGSIARPPWNARFNLFAALLAASSLGFLAPTEKVCVWQHLPLLCQ